MHAGLAARTSGVRGKSEDAMPPCSQGDSKTGSNAAIQQKTVMAKRIIVALIIRVYTLIALISSAQNNEVDNRGVKCKSIMLINA